MGLCVIVGPKLSFIVGLLGRADLMMWWGLKWGRVVDVGASIVGLR